MSNKKHAFVLCSGGLDSTVTASLIASQNKYSKITILFFNYGQNSLKEERAASKLCAKNIHAFFHELALPEMYNIARATQLQAKKIKTSQSLKDTSKESAAWYFPCRNLIFLNYALALAESDFVSKKIITDIFVGFKSEGKEPFPDATQAFLDKLNAVSKECCAYPFVILAPLINKDKEDIVLLGQKLGVETDQTFSCYSSKNGKHCGVCLACRIRKAGFYWSGVPDATEYVVT